MADPDRIWLEPGCAEHADRCWCEHRPPDCPEEGCGEKAVEYVRADLAAARTNAAVREALEEAVASVQLASTQHIRAQIARLDAALLAQPEGDADAD